MCLLSCTVLQDAHATSGAGAGAGGDQRYRQVNSPQGMLGLGFKLGLRRYAVTRDSGLVF
jgi:hypothetical protein